jgi:oxygen-dependent protoporphyrinogen oxidase
MAIVVLAFDRADVGERLTGSGFLVPPVDGRTVKAATFSSHKWGWMADGPVVVRCSIGRHGEEFVLQRDDHELVDAAFVDLSDATGLRSRPLDARVVRWGGALPQYVVGHLDRVARIRQAVDQMPGLAVCGAAYDGLGIPACIASAHEAATRILEVVTAPETMGP